MGSNTKRVTKVFVSNSVAANTGTSVPTITNNDVLIMDRGLALLSSDTIGGDAKNDLIYIALGNGAVGEATIESIQVKNIRKVTTQLYSKPVQKSATITGENFNLAANTEYSVSIEFHDTGRVAQDKPTRQYFVYKSTSNAASYTQAAVVNGLMGKINAAKLSYVTASNVSDDLVITGNAVTANSINSYQFVNFTVSMRGGFIEEPTAVTYAGGFQGQGVGQIVRDMELDNTNNFNRIQWPLDEDTRRATNGGFYNLVVIEYSNSHTGDLLQNYNAPKTLVLAFAAAETLETTAMDAISETAIASKKQNDFITALASLVESAGVTFVLA